MENDKFERVIFKLLRIFGIIGIIGGFLEEDLLIRHNFIRIGHIIFISPILIIKMTVVVVLYRVFLSILEKHISITKKIS